MPRGEAEQMQGRPHGDHLFGQITSVGDLAAQQHPRVVGEPGHQHGGDGLGDGPYVEPVAQGHPEVVQEGEPAARRLGLVECLQPFGDVHHRAAHPDDLTGAVGQLPVREGAGAGPVRCGHDHVHHGASGLQHPRLDAEDLLGEPRGQYVGDGLAEEVATGRAVQFEQGFVPPDVAQPGVEEGDAQRRGDEQSVQRGQVVFDGLDPPGFHQGGEDQGPSFGVLEHRAPPLDLDQAPVPVPEPHTTAPFVGAAQDLCARTAFLVVAGDELLEPVTGHLLRGPAADLLRRGAPQQDSALFVEHDDADAQGVQK